MFDVPRMPGIRILLSGFIFGLICRKRPKKSAANGTGVALHLRRDSVASPESHWFDNLPLKLSLPPWARE
jgi:hypothetical protein